MRTSRREQSPVPVASQYELHVLWHCSSPASCVVSQCSMSQLAQPLKATALLFIPHKGRPKHRGRSRAEHTSWQAFWDACLQSPFGLEGVQARVVDPLPERGLSSNRTERSIRERQLCIKGMRRQGTSVSSSEKEGPVMGLQWLSAQHHAKDSEAEKSWVLMRKLTTHQKGKWDISAFPLSLGDPPGTSQPCSGRVTVVFSQGAMSHGRSLAQVLCFGAGVHVLYAEID